MMNDLDGVAVRILEVARACAVAMRSRLRIDRHAVTLQKRRPRVDIFRFAHDEPEMIERVHALLLRETRRVDVERQIVEARRQVNVLGIGFPFHGKAEQVHIEVLHRLEIADVQREVPEAGVGWTSHADTLQLNRSCLESRLPSPGVRCAAPKKCLNRAAKRNIAGTAGTRRLRLKRSSRGISLSSATSAQTAPRNISSTIRRRSGPAASSSWWTTAMTSF